MPDAFADAERLISLPVVPEDRPPHWLKVQPEVWYQIKTICRTLLALRPTPEVKAAMERIKRNQTEPGWKVYGECPDNWESPADYFMHMEMLDREIVSDAYLAALSTLENT